jgi:RNA polymerase sigma-70 factor, ECF subfamily
VEQERPVSDLVDRRDRELLEHIAAGSEDAFAELYGRYAGTAAGVGHRVLGDDGLAEEVLQEVFLSVWRRAASFDPARGSVRSWLLAQIHHRAVDAVRREEAERRRAVRVTADVPDGVEEVVEEEWMRVRRGEVRRAIGELPDEQRAILELSYFRGMTQTQIARTTGTPLGTVKSRTLAALRRLRRDLGRAELE